MKGEGRMGNERLKKRGRMEEYGGEVGWGLRGGKTLVEQVALSFSHYEAPEEDKLAE